MSASMAAILGNHYVNYYPSRDWECTSLQCDFKAKNFSDAMEHVAGVLAANGYGKLDATKFVLAEREAELLNLKGPCSNAQCPLHFAHRGPCDLRRPE